MTTVIVGDVDPRSAASLIIRNRWPSRVTSSKQCVIGAEREQGIFDHITPGWDREICIVPGADPALPAIFSSA
jgi:hypothetical protein